MSRTTDVQRTARCVQLGGVIVYPTEAVYGLGCDPGNRAALQRLLKIKARKPDKGLVLVAENLDQLEPFIQPFSPTIRARTAPTWPGPVTWVVPARATIDPLLSGSRSTLAVRVSAHPTVRALCNACSHALVSTSANISGQIPLLDPADIDTAFTDLADLFLDGLLGDEPCATSIFDATSGLRLR